MVVVVVVDVGNDCKVVVGVSDTSSLSVPLVNSNTFLMIKSTSFGPSWINISSSDCLKVDDFIVLDVVMVVEVVVVVVVDDVVVCVVIMVVVDVERSVEYLLVRSCSEYGIYSMIGSTSETFNDESVLGSAGTAAKDTNFLRSGSFASW